MFPVTVTYTLTKNSFQGNSTLIGLLKSDDQHCLQFHDSPSRWIQFFKEKMIGRYKVETQSTGREITHAYITKNVKIAFYVLMCSYL